MIYSYRCRECGRTRDLGFLSQHLECVCGKRMKRDYSTVQLPRRSTFQPHFNHAVGRVVSSYRDFENALKVASERNSIATGIDHNYTAIEPGDMAKLEPTTDTESIEKARKAQRDGKVDSDDVVTFQ